MGSVRASVASRFVQYGIASRPSSGGTLEVDPTAIITFFVASSWVAPSWVTVTVPIPLMQPSPLYATTPAASRAAT